MKIRPGFPVLLMLAALPVHATEGALGRSITGLQGTSFAGVVPPTPGFNLAVGYIYYSGDIGAERETPLAGGGTALGLSATARMLSLTGVYVWDTGEGRWNFASAAALPYAQMDADVRLRTGTVSGGVSDSASGLFDATFVPVIASRHFSATRHMSLALYISAPTGSYKEDRLAQLSLNTWVYSPTIGYTQLFQEGTLEFTVVGGFDFYTDNDATDYQSGAVGHLDALLVKRFGNGWSLGASGGWVQQLEDDSGPTADRLDGFKGHALAIGPVAGFTKKWEGGQVEFQARWLHEFEVKNRLEGEPVLVSATISF